MERVLIFDVDGTLTGPRRVIHEDFARFFRFIVQNEIVFLVSGSDMPKLQQQLPGWLIDTVAGIFTCSGNELWQNGQVMFQMNHTFPEEVLKVVRQLLAKSPYDTRTGQHLEFRTGTLNVSVVGRNANPLQRKDYNNHDKKTSERERICSTLNEQFAEYEASAGGQISVDISPRGWNKSRVYTELVRKFPDYEFHFFGDNIKDGGNDLPLAAAIEAGGDYNRIHAVVDHFETWKILQTDYVHDPAKGREAVA